MNLTLNYIHRMIPTRDTDLTINKTRYLCLLQRQKPTDSVAPRKFDYKVQVTEGLPVLSFLSFCDVLSKSQQIKVIEMNMIEYSLLR